MNLQNQLNGDSLAWLLEEESPGVRYLAMRDLLDYPATTGISSRRVIKPIPMVR